MYVRTISTYTFKHYFWSHRVCLIKPRRMAYTFFDKCSLRLGDDGFTRALDTMFSQVVCPVRATARLASDAVPAAAWAFWTSSLPTLTPRLPVPHWAPTWPCPVPRRRTSACWTWLARTKSGSASRQSAILGWPRTDSLVPYRPSGPGGMKENPTTTTALKIASRSAWAHGMTTRALLRYRCLCVNWKTVSVWSVHSQMIRPRALRA